MDIDAEQARTVGLRLRWICKTRGKSLRVLAELAGMNRVTLSRIESGERAVTFSEIVVLAGALEIAPSELTTLPVPTPADGETDAAVPAVRLALRAATDDLPDGLVLPMEALRTRVTITVDALRRCEREWEAGAALPDLIRDLHTSIATSRDAAQLLDLVVLLHTQVTIPWLRLAGAPLDLSSQPLLLARQAARDRGTAVKRTADADAALEQASELAARTGEGNAYGLGFDPTDVGLWRMAAALRIGDPERAATS